MLRPSNLNKIGSSFPRGYSPMGQTDIETDKLEVGALVQEELEHRSGSREEDAGGTGSHCRVFKKLLCHQ